MDHAFEVRKQELEQECIMPAGMFADVRSRLDDFIQPFLESLFRYKQRDHATTVVSGVCSDLERKNAESIAYHFGLERKTIQHFIGESQWDDAPLNLERRRI